MLEQFYRSLYRIRRVEEEVARVYPTDKVKSPVHLSIGQEFISVAVCEALAPQDVAFGTYRGHALYLAKGGDLREMIAELYGKATGCAKGKGGSMHLVNVKAGFMGASAVVGTSIPHAVGHALAMKLQKRDTVTVNFFGDGAIEEGVFHESLNFASLKNLPVLFICENNFYAIHAHQKTRQKEGDICRLASAHGIPTERIESGDLLEVYERVKAAVDAMRAGLSGPRFFEIMAYRWMEHVGPNEDYHFGYRDRAEAEAWLENDQLRRVGEQLLPERRRAIEAEVEAEIRDAFEFAESSPFPEEEELFTDLFKEA